LEKSGKFNIVSSFANQPYLSMETSNVFYFFGLEISLIAKLSGWNISIWNLLFVKSAKDRRTEQKN
jgi:hypothetical protein